VDRGSNPIADLFVYGTLTDPAERQQILGHPSTLVPASLRGYRRRDGRYPYLVKADGNEVRGSIVRDLGDEDFARLDAYEVVNAKFVAGALRRLYRRKSVEVVTVAGLTLQCWAYMADLAEWPRDWR
jgi:gamma-glutamylcyclotransferase (GGCT)/AIG2-like uncharacterized protein YtfP